MKVASLPVHELGSRDMHTQKGGSLTSVTREWVLRTPDP